MLPFKPLPKIGHQCHMISLLLVLLLWIATVDEDTVFLALSQPLCAFLIIVDKWISVSLSPSITHSINESRSLSNHNYSVNMFFLLYVLVYLLDWPEPKCVRFCVSPILWVFFCLVVCVCRYQSLANPPSAGGLYLIQMNLLLFFKRVRLATDKSPFTLSTGTLLESCGDYTNILTGWIGCWQISPK